MNVAEAIKIRRSVRDYQSRAVPEDKLNRVLEAARLAPSAHNSQNWRFVVVLDEQKRKELAEAAASQDFVGEAPVVIAAVTLAPEAMMGCGVPSYAVDLAIAVDHMTLQAVEEGLGTCWIGAFSQDKVKEILGVPAQYKVVALLALGFPDDSPSLKNRKSLEEIVSFEKFEE